MIDYEELLTSLKRSFMSKQKGLPQKDSHYRDMSAVMEGGVVVKSMGLVLSPLMKKVS